MERSHDLEKDQPIWGTREDLLLASAVGRHGRRSWDSVAVEIKHRIPSGDLINAEVCQQRYRILERRRLTSSGDEDGVQKADGEGISTETEIYEELKSLWMDELRRDVQRREVTIASLKLKVKKLTEERERNLREAAAGDGSPDLKPAVAENGEPPGIVNGDRVPGENSGHSCKESNSTDPIKDTEKKPGESVKGAAVASGAREEKSVGDGSYYGSSETIAKAAARPPEIVESGDSVAESKGTLENSDVQSSASLSRRRRGRRGKAVSVPNGGVERGADPVAEESRPLLAFLETVRSDGCGSVFERRLQSQEGISYRGLIRRHVDLEIVRSKMRGGGTYTMTELFRDLLVLCNNAIVYYPKGSHEYISAVHLRQLVSKDIPATVLKSIPPPVKESTPELESSKPVLLVPLIACRKRSSIAIAAKKDGREEDSVGLEEKTKERGARAITGTRGPRTNNSRGEGGRSRNPKADPKLDEVMSENTTDPVVAKNEKKVAGGVAKKRSMANFLNRINRGSPKGSSLLETLKKSSNSTSGGEEKKIAGRRRDGRKGSVASVKAAEAEKSATVKKGRPPKRGAPPTLRKASKRAREEKIPPPSSRKRGRR